jgi:putative redox protein
MGVLIQGKYNGGLEMVMTHGPSGNQVKTDPPVDNGGTGSAFSPTDLLATSLGACMMSVLALHAKKVGWNLMGMRVVVEKVMTASLPRKVHELKVDLTLPVALGSEDRRKAREIAENCPVALSLGEGVRVPLALHFE